MLDQTKQALEAMDEILDHLEDCVRSNRLLPARTAKNEPARLHVAYDLHMACQYLRDVREALTITSQAE